MSNARQRPGRYIADSGRDGRDRIRALRAKQAMGQRLSGVAATQSRARIYAVAGSTANGLG